jgi:DNA-binding CsgD family transcriptional regulator
MVGQFVPGSRSSIWCTPAGWITVPQAQTRTGIGRARIGKAIQDGHLTVRWHIHSATGRPARHSISIRRAIGWLTRLALARTSSARPLPRLSSPVDTGEPIAAIAADLHVTESALYRVAARHGQTFAPPAPALDVAQVEEAARLYASGMSTTELGRRYNRASGTVAKALRGRGVRLRVQSGAKRRKRWRYDAFSRQDRDTAYWVGFIHADGSLQMPTKKKLAIAL